MWKAIRCRVFGEHDYQLRREPRALLLECQRCGHRSHGWNLAAEPRTQHLEPQNLEPRTATSEFRLFIAESGRANGGVRRIATRRSPARVMGSDSLRLTFGQDEGALRGRQPLGSSSRAQIVIDSPVG